MTDNRYSHRYSSAVIRLTDESGAPLANTDVTFDLTKHEFLFGSGAFDSLPIAGPRITDPAFFEKHPNFSYEVFEKRMDKFAEIFNYGTLPFYWGGFEPKEGEPQTENRMNAAKYLISRGATPKGHPLCWHTACADWLLKYDNKTIMDKQLERINRDVTAFRGIIDIWDAINETVIMPEFDRYDNAITRICNAYGRTTLIKEVFDAAHAANPDAVLLINDFNLSPKYAEVIDECLNAGVPIHAIGIQTHQHQGYRGMAWLNEVLDRFSVFGLPLHFTENTLISGELMPSHIVDLNDWQVEEWPSTPEGEARQAKEWVEMYERLFDHPLVEAITGWDLADGAWLNAPSGLLRKDGSAKPAFDALKHLVKEEWHTKVTLKTNDNGCVALNGIRGTYTATSAGKSATLKLDKKTNEMNVTLA